MKIDIESIKLLVIKPDEYLLIKLPRKISMYSLERTNSYLKSVFKDDFKRVLLYTEGSATLKKVRFADDEI